MVFKRDPDTWQAFPAKKRKYSPFLQNRHSPPFLRVIVEHAEFR
jgi:hypothetical protein